ncbi:LNS2 (Lipin/Ned1/Smp2) protein [Besnoitia besnoiti]|uniref:phosphatidate phosphatase n=1 Tax=Besnoitia besnoiti TaxID=94643 RepID=A0A2A9MQT7_BESBE|nr:LNS2 (Lipin/Ned1/Smp2) protein [Besnoitia besnoiti]PFH38707.1 LNS2 (Lipin/Ned1/Smp2) protein [Besnoitia besnoiti]
MWGKIVSSVSNALDFNQATLSGCIDIICVRSTQDNKLRSTPFHVRFGKAKLLRSREKTVTVTVNGQLTSLRMKLGAAGEAYFVHEDESDADDEDEAASPIVSPRSNASGDGDKSGAQSDAAGASPAHAKLGASTDERDGVVTNETSTEIFCRDAAPPQPLGAGPPGGAASPASGEPEPKAPSGDAARAGEEFATGESQLPVPRYSSGDPEQDRARLLLGDGVGGVGAGAGVSPETQKTRDFPEDEQFGAGPATNSAAAADTAAGAASGVSFSLCGHMLTGRITEEQHDNDVFNANVVSWEAFDHNPALWYHPSLVARFDDKPPYYPGKVALPLLACWLVFNRPLSLESLSQLMNAEISANFPQSNFSSALSSASRWIFGGGRSSSAAKPALLGPAPAPKKSDGAPGAEAGKRGEDVPLGRGKSVVVGSRDPIAQATVAAATAVAIAEEEAGVSPPDDEGDWRREGRSTLANSASFHSELGSTGPSLVSCAACTPRRLRRSLRPTPDQLDSLNLKPGANSICFTVSSSLQGTKSVMGTIYLWPQYPKIVISDVDGTITRSDVLGQLMPIVGRDWSHDGVAELFTKIKKAGYLILYLTARAIGQADATRDYLFGLTQQQTNKLPDGPLILSPDRLFPSFKREVIERKPYIFKIAALRDIRSLFPPEYNPFYAGFGNRDSDHRAYVHVGVAEAKVFIIDPSGAIHHINNSTYARTYETMSEIADFMFPPLPRPDGRLPSEARVEEEEAEEEQVRERKRLVFTLHIDDEQIHPVGLCNMICANAARALPILD